MKWLIKYEGEHTIIKLRYIILILIVSIVSIILIFNFPTVQKEGTQLYEGYNHIGWYHGETTASEIASQIPTCEQIIYFDPVIQQDVIWPTSPDFPVVDGMVIFVVVLESSVWEEDYIHDPITVTLYSGWNTIAWYRDTTIMASELATQIPTCELMSYFDPVLQTYRSYIVGGPSGFDFEISKGICVSVTVADSSQYSW